MEDSNIIKAIDFYQSRILDLKKQQLLEEYNFSVTGNVPFQDWELFGAILVGDKKSEGYGSDLTRHEIKSAVTGNSFEYQYHRNHGEDKLIEDIELDWHVFISYSRDYRNIVVRRVPGSALEPTFRSWLAGLRDAYTGPNPRQRYRRSISYGWVAENGEIILQIKGGLRVANHPPLF